MLNPRGVTKRTETYFLNPTIIPLLILVLLVSTSSVYPGIISSTENNETIIIRPVLAQPEKHIVKLDSSGHHASIPGFPSIDVPTPLTSNNTPNNDDFTTQASLTVTRATQTNNIVSAKSYYDIMFKPTTSGIIKTIDFDFPPGTYVGVAKLTEAVGIGPGKISHSGAAATGQTITYTVDNAVNVPAFTNIRVQLANINNPSVPNNALTVTIITRDSSGNIIDGPTSTTAYIMEQIGNTQIADEAVTSSKLADGAVGSNDLDPELMISRFLRDDARGNSFGWNPNGMETDFIIIDEAIEDRNAVLINVGDNVGTVPTDSNSQCEARGSLTGFFTIRCDTAPPQGSELRYTITNIPLS